MITNNYTILAPQGIHARPATMLIKLAKGFKSAISIKKDGKTVKLNSMLGLLSLNIKGGETVAVMIEGEDQVEAERAVNQFFNDYLKDL
ncbi:HPr family phosphocarrier protein [Mucilaginibacter sp. L3T2-6]|uniref:HPr family phosphocarrier protein n=1 Tax=Mucilaginibacter sp. L3T2-6 TaxID=3062491 RepID=UPI0026749987|nr:HPr family phosphocarrier protein [Mucilaginibacter sp. L3T2-6]MDO3642373.1 HPr family phosphocarrier protein [Mucilaginibacter sp. L3T2-6]MDV6214868.1 HPr family phosphocarrier protein [Mucilaginibacter sp. L3T2-6]